MKDILFSHFLEESVRLNYATLTKEEIVALNKKIKIPHNYFAIDEKEKIQNYLLFAKKSKNEKIKLLLNIASFFNITEEQLALFYEKQNKTYNHDFVHQLEKYSALGNKPFIMLALKAFAYKEMNKLEEIDIDVLYEMWQNKELKQIAEQTVEWLFN